MEYNLRSRTKKHNNTIIPSGVYYDYYKHIHKKFGYIAMDNIINESKVKYETIWNNTEKHKRFQIFSQLLSEEFHNIFTKGIFNIHDEVYNYFRQANNFSDYTDWSNTIYDVFSDAENNMCIQNKQPTTRNFIVIIRQFHTLHEMKLQEHYKNKKKFIKSAIVMVKVQHIRALHLFINRNYYKIFSFKLIPFIQNFYNNRFKHMNDINTFIIPSGDFDKNRCKYLLLSINTFKKGPLGHAHFIGLVLNRLFCKDIALYICDFI